MGAVISLILDAVEIAANFGVGAEAILTGEALAILESQVEALVLTEGITFSEALTSLGVTGAEYSTLAGVASGLQQAGFALQAAAALGPFVAVGFDLASYHNAIPVSTMALVPYYDPADYDILFPGVSWLARNIHYFDPSLWTTRIWQTFVQSLQRQAYRQISYQTSELASRAGQQATELAVRTGQQAATSLSDALAKIVEATQWVVTNIQDAISGSYSAITDYYAELPGLNPPQRRALLARIESMGTDLEKAGIPRSGEFVQKYAAPGGASQRTCPNWILPLILGLYETPESWTQPISKNATKRKRSSENSGSKVNNKRRR
uniref:Minor capsid protein VP2 n=2 Tax=Sciurus carolinensis polyomavirus 1 TaxID=2721750 RepID=A0A6G9LXF5_9POLY|nr:viral protein 2 [Sciurus carolinensis polyomavirus 1]QIQ69366.1 viral protein 2 [Sciurus carolinensis polyomavirus 1]